MSNFVGSFILFPNTLDQKVHWLAHWNYERQEYMLPGTGKKPFETFQHCLVSEIEKTFELVPFDDFVLSEEALAHLAFSEKILPSQVADHFIIELFEFQSLNELAQQVLERDLRNRWVSEQEIEEGSCIDGFPISGLFRSLFHKANLANRLS